MLLLSALLSFYSLNSCQTSKYVKKIGIPLFMFGATVGSTLLLGNTSMITNYVGSGYGASVRGPVTAVPRLPRYIALATLIAGAAAFDHFVPMPISWTPIASILAVTSLRKEIKIFTTEKKSSTPESEASACALTAKKVATVKQGTVTTILGAATYAASCVWGSANLLTGYIGGTFAMQVKKKPFSSFSRLIRYPLLGAALGASLAIDLTVKPTIPVTPVVGLSIFSAIKKEIKLFNR